MALEMMTLNAKSIAIVGAGPSGIVAAKYLQAEKAFDKIVLFEQRSKSGGIWNYTGDQHEDDLFRIPQIDPRGKNQDPVWRDASKKSAGTDSVNGANGGNGTAKASFLSPVYERLETNIPRGLMGFQDLDWPEESQLFPEHETVLQYIEHYGKDVQDFVRHETQVINIEPTDDDYGGRWNIFSRTLSTSIQKEEVFDAVIVANGHFIVPYLPKISGIEEWEAMFPGAISHSKYYRRPEDFVGKKVVVVGNSASGSDISTQICQYSQRPILWSSKSPSMFSTTASSAKKCELPPISKFLPQNRGVMFEDGTVETDIDSVVFATGYFYSLPFLENVQPKLITDGSHVNHTYQHIFYAPRPTLSFLALNQRVIPFPLAEAQASVLARVYSGRLSLPSLSTMQAWERKQIEEMGDGRNFHLLAPLPKDGIYINEMSNWALTASPRAGLDNDGKGKIPPIWRKKEFWCRETFAAIRLAFGALGEERHKVKTLEEMGFSYEERLK